LNRAVFKVNYRRHEGQREVLAGILKSKADIITIVCSRGWGKTLFTTCDIVLPVMLNVPHAQVLWIAPTYKICKSPIDDVWMGIDEQSGQRFIPQNDPTTGFQFWDYKRGDMEIHMFNQAVLYHRSADNPDSIVSKGYNLIVIDEAAQISREVFFQHILPTARRKNCKIVLITTPRGRNWIYEFYLEGQDPSKPEHVSFRQPWWKRPDYPLVLQRLMKGMPEHLRKQEFEAEFIQDGVGAFKNLAAIFEGPPIEFTDDTFQEWFGKVDVDQLNAEPWVVAVDFAKSEDYTAIGAMGIESRRLSYYCRMNKRDYKTQLNHLDKVCQRFDMADLIYDKTGVGRGLEDFLGRSSNNYGFQFTNDSKNELVNKLIAATDYAEIKLPNIVTMRNEFELFTYDITRTGKLSYNAPEGKHDDTVIMVGLANWFCVENGGKGHVEEVNDFLNIVASSNEPKSEYQKFLEED